MRQWLGFILLGCAALSAQAADTVRVGAVGFGTLNWELATVQRLGLDQSHGFNLQVQTLANPQAGAVALQADSVDVIVNDWLWVSRQRENGADFTFMPYSASHGVLLVAPNAPIHNVADLAGKRLGIAGGGLDKNWLLLRALAKDRYGVDLEKSADVVFGAPPLLNAQLQQGRLDAVLNYWHYAAKLQTQGLTALLDGQEILRQLGVTVELPNLGYVYHAGWAAQHPNAAQGFFAATREAKQRLCDNDADWAAVQTLTQETQPAVLSALRLAYCAGRVSQFGAAERQAATTVYRLLKQTGGADAAGRGDAPADGTFQDLP